MRTHAVSRARQFGPAPVVLGLLLAGLCIGAARGQMAIETADGPEACAGTVERVLAEHGLTDRVTGVEYDVNYSYGVEDRRPIGINARVGLEGCEGRLVVDLHTNCSVRDVYTSSGCRIAGIPAY
jgi:hypothetical protein